MSSRAAIRYAKAILDQAKEKGTEEVVFGNMKSIDDFILPKTTSSVPFSLA